MAPVPTFTSTVIMTAGPSCCGVVISHWLASLRFLIEKSISHVRLPAYYFYLKRVSRRFWGWSFCGKVYTIVRLLFGLDNANDYRGQSPRGQCADSPQCFSLFSLERKRPWSYIITLSRINDLGKPGKPKSVWLERDSGLNPLQCESGAYS